MKSDSELASGNLSYFKIGKPILIIYAIRKPIIGKISRPTVVNACGN